MNLEKTEELVLVTPTEDELLDLLILANEVPEAAAQMLVEEHATAEMSPTSIEIAYTTAVRWFELAAEYTRP